MSSTARPRSAVATASPPRPTSRPCWPIAATQIADQQSVFQLVTMMQGVVKRGTGRVADLGLSG